MEPAQPWPVPAGRDAAKAAPTTASRALALEAEAKALGHQMADELVAMLRCCADHAADLAALNGMSGDVRQIAERIQNEATSRAASLAQLTRPAADSGDAAAPAA